MRLTQYFESQEDQNITRLTLLYQNLRGGGERMFLSLLKGERGLYSNGKEDMNEMSFNGRLVGS